MVIVAATVLAHPNRLGEYPEGHDVLIVAVAASVSVTVLTHVAPLPR